MLEFCFSLFFLMNPLFHNCFVAKQLQRLKIRKQSKSTSLQGISNAQAVKGLQELLSLNLVKLGMNVVQIKWLCVEIESVSVLFMLVKPFVKFALRRFLLRWQPTERSDKGVGRWLSRVPRRARFYSFAVHLFRSSNSR